LSRTSRGDPRGDIDPLVDIGIPTFQRPDFLKEAVESILAQTLQRWRLVVSEDGPGGGEVEHAMERYLSDPRVRYRAHRTHVGVVHNKNELLGDAKAPYVAVLDDDDRWDPDFLARRLTFLEQHPECGFVFSGFVEIDETGRTIRHSEHI
jgi:glycosyltransferase involved in cell wall biosynthesis